MDADAARARPGVLPVPVRTAASGAAPLLFYDTLLDALSALGEGVAVLEGGTFLYANAALADMLGYEMRELVRPGFHVRALAAPEASGDMEDRLRQRFSREKLGDHYETVLLHKTGRRVEVEISVKPLHGVDTSLRFAVVRDITARRAAESALQRAHEELTRSEKLAALGSLVSGVAHEVRTPLVSIQNGAVLLRRRIERIAEGPRDPQTLEEAFVAIREIEEGVDRVARLVRDLSRYTKLPTDQMQASRLDVVVEDALRLWRSTHRWHAIDIAASLAPTEPLRLDRAKVQQLVINLLQNAEEAMPTGGRVVVRTEPCEHGARLSVVDEGIGIPRDVQARMFEPLFTTKEAGMGLGLSIVKRIVELHHGSITCESVVGGGAAFLVTLPA